MGPLCFLRPPISAEEGASIPFAGKEEGKQKTPAFTARTSSCPWKGQACLPCCRSVYERAVPECAALSRSSLLHLLDYRTPSCTGPFARVMQRGSCRKLDSGGRWHMRQASFISNKEERLIPIWPTFVWIVQLVLGLEVWQGMVISPKHSNIHRADMMVKTATWILRN